MNQRGLYVCIAKMANPQEGVFAGVSIGYSANYNEQSVEPLHQPGDEGDPYGGWTDSGGSHRRLDAVFVDGERFPYGETEMLEAGEGEGLRVEAEEHHGRRVVRIDTVEMSPEELEAERKRLEEEDARFQEEHDFRPAANWPRARRRTYCRTEYNRRMGTVKQKLGRVYAKNSTTYDHHSRWVNARTAADAVESMTVAGRDSYNYFKPDKAAAAIEAIAEKDPNALFSLGREGSPVIYVQTYKPSSAIGVLSSMENKYQPDELGKVTGKRGWGRLERLPKRRPGASVVRAWWD